MKQTLDDLKADVRTLKSATLQTSIPSQHVESRESLQKKELGKSASLDAWDQSQAEPADDGSLEMVKRRVMKGATND